MMFTQKIRPLLTRVYYGALGGGLLSSSILCSNTNSSTTMTEQIVAHCQDGRYQRRNHSSSSSSSSGGGNSDHVEPIPTNKNHSYTINDEEDDGGDKLTRQGFNRADFDIYLTNPTKQDLLPLLNEYITNNKNVWPWIWTWHNSNGPHYIFVGTNSAINDRIVQLANESPQNNIIVITNNNDNDSNSSSSSTVSGGGSSSNKHALTQDVSFYYTNRCGIIENVTIQEIDITNKIILLSDERILCFTELYIV